MIEKVTLKNFEDFKKACKIEPIFGSKCLNAHISHSGGGYLQYNEDGKPVLGGYLADGVFVISSDNSGDINNLAKFITDNNVKEIDTNLLQCLALQKILGGRKESSFYMQFCGEKFTENFSCIKKSKDLKEVFDILQSSHEYYCKHIEFEPWAADIAAKFNKNFIEIYTLYSRGKAVGTSCIASQDDDCAVIAAVAVLPHHRGKKYGTLLCKFLTNRILELNKTPKLISADDGVSKMYAAIGYEKIDRWGELYL